MLLFLLKKQELGKKKKVLIFSFTNYKWLYYLMLEVYILNILQWL